MNETTLNGSNEIKKEEKTIDVVPLTKGKRALLFLSDFFLNFILSFILLNILVVPLGKVFTNYNAKNSTYESNVINRATVLYDNGVVIDSGDVEKDNVMYNVSFSYYCYLSYYCYDEETPPNMTHAQFGHKTANEVIRHYFIDILNDEAKYLSFLTTYKADKYFTITGSVLSLKDEYKNQIAPYFKEGEEASSTGKGYIDSIENEIFYPLYSEVLNLIEKNDLVSGDYSYNELTKSIKEYESYYKTFIIVTAFVGFFLSTVVLYLVVPIFNQNKRTVSMMIMKIDRISFDHLTLVKKYECVVSTIYALITNMLAVFFIPMLQASIYDLFNIPVLYVFGLLSIVFMLGSLIFLLFNAYNRSIFDFLTRTVYLKSEELDKIYRAKGYYV